MSADQTRIPFSALGLGLAGLVPFAVGALSLWVDLSWLSAETGLKVVVNYGAIILSFLGGIRWGTAIGPYDTRRQGAEFGLSVLGALAGLAALLLSPLPALLLLIVGFLSQAYWDVTSAESGRLPIWFGRLRMVLTVGAVGSLVAALTTITI